MSWHNSVVKATTGELATIAIVQTLYINFFTNMADLSTRFTWVKDLHILCSENLFITEITECVTLALKKSIWHREIPKDGPFFCGAESSIYR